MVNYLKNCVPSVRFNVLNGWKPNDTVFALAAVEEGGAQEVMMLMPGLPLWPLLWW